MPDVVYEDEHLVVRELASKRVVLVHRKPTRPTDPVELTRSYRAALEQADQHRGWGLVLDMREAPGRSDEDFERAMSSVTATARRVFSKVVLLVATATGELHTTRVARQQGRPQLVTRDEAEAVALAVPAP